MTKLFLTIDNGGTNTKTILFNENGDQLAVTSFSTPRIEKIAGEHEIDLEQLWIKIAEAIRTTIDKVQINAEEIAAVIPVGHGKGLYLLDQQHSVFYPGILSTDSRGTELATAFETKVAEIYGISLQHVMPSQAPVLLRWLKNNKPNVYQNIGAILSAKDFVRFKLTGYLAQEYGDASGNNLVNLKTKKYAPELLDFFGIEECLDKLPPLVASTDIVGSVTAHVSKQTGLALDTPVIGGLFDIDACTLATGVTSNDAFSSIAGTWNINVFPSETPSGIETKTMNSLFADGSYLIEASSPTSAGNLEMMLQMLMNEERNNATAAGNSIYTILEDFLNETSANFTKAIFFPFLYGSNANPEAEGAFLGIRSSTTKSELIRAVYEGIVFAHRDHIERLVSILKRRPKTIRLSGGATNSNAWIQIFADILSIPVEIVNAKELGGLGGAIVGAVAINAYSSIQEAIDHMVTVVRTFEPVPSESKIYDQKYKVYQEALKACDPLWESLRKMQEGLSVNEFARNI